MALTDLGMRIAYPPMWEHASGNFNRSLDADGEKFAYCFPIHKSGDITAIDFYVGAFTQCTNGLTVSIETVGTDGFPTGTNYGGSSPATGVSVGATGWFTATLATEATATKGDRVAVVITWTTWASGNNIGIRCHYYATGSFGYPLVATYESSAWGFRNMYKMVGALKYTSTYYPDDPLIGGGGADYTYDSSTSPDEIGNKFTLPFGCRVTGAWFSLATIKNANIRVRVYDSSDVVQATVTIGDTDEVVNQTREFSLVDFTTAAELDVDTVYRIAIEVLDTTDTISLTGINVGTAARMASFPLGADCIRTYRTDAGSWTDDSDDRANIGLLIDQINVGEMAYYMHSMC